MRKKTRKRIRIDLVVSVPVGMTAKEARREVKTLITHQANWAAGDRDVIAIAVNPVKRGF